MAIKRGTNKGLGLSAERLQHIENYELSLFNLVNHNTKGMLMMNPLAGESALSMLKGLSEELGAITIDVKEVDCNRIFNRIDLTETEMFICSINHRLAYSNYTNDYKKMLSDKELLEMFPIAERKKRITELEQEIKREVMKIASVGRVNKSLRKACEQKAEELRAELHSIEKTMDIVEEEYINNMLYMLAVSKIAEVKARIAYKIEYLEGVLN